MKKFIMDLDMVELELVVKFLLTGIWTLIVRIVDMNCLDFDVNCPEIVQQSRVYLDGLKKAPGVIILKLLGYYGLCRCENKAKIFLARIH